MRLGVNCECFGFREWVLVSWQWVLQVVETEDIKDWILAKRYVDAGITTYWEGMGAAGGARSRAWPFPDGKSLCDQIEPHGAGNHDIIPERTGT